MNQYPNQQGLQGQGQQGFQGGQGQNFNYQPSGYVQSNYQGQLSQPSFGQYQSSPAQSPVSGYQAANYQQNIGTAAGYLPSSFTTQPAYAQQQFGVQGQPTYNYASQQTQSQHRPIGPVIAHFGYQAGPEQHPSGFQTSAMGGASFGQSYSGYGNASNIQPQGQYGTSVQSQASQHPVYQATNAYAQSGPVISKLGWQAGPDAGYARSTW